MLAADDKRVMDLPKTAQGGRSKRGKSTAYEVFTSYVSQDSDGVMSLVDGVKLATFPFRYSYLD